MNATGTLQLRIYVNAMWSRRWSAHLRSLCYLDAKKGWSLIRCVVALYCPASGAYAGVWPEPFSGGLAAGSAVSNQRTRLKKMPSV